MSTMTSSAAPALQIQLLNDAARAPTRGSAFAAGYDLYASEDNVVPARGKAMVDTGISIAVPAGTCAYTLLLPFLPLPYPCLEFGLAKEAPEPRMGHNSLVPVPLPLLTDYIPDGRVAPRSGLAAKHSIDVGAGVIDADYRGPVKVILFNFSDADFAIKTGDRIAQLIIERIYTPEVVVVEKLEESVRGAGGFGSTGGFGVVAGAVNGA